MDSKVYLGIDTSNYTTSVAAVDENENILYFNKKLLDVKEGELGLRQSNALWQHWDRLPDFLNEVLKNYSKKIAGISASVKPRPQVGSYMPCFTAGSNIAKIISSALNIDFIPCTHQEGHIFAAAYKNSIDLSKPFLVAHLSGGTLELVLVENNQYRIVASTNDISYGQLIDRTGVLLGYSFPAGATIDKLALEFNAESFYNKLCNISIKDNQLSLSGIETQMRQSKLSESALAYSIMERISQSLYQIIERCKELYKVESVLITGGVACSKFLRENLKDKGYIFGNENYCSDNALGVALYAKYKQCQ